MTQRIATAAIALAVGVLGAAFVLGVKDYVDMRAAVKQHTQAIAEIAQWINAQPRAIAPMPAPTPAAKASKP